MRRAQYSRTIGIVLTAIAVAGAYSFIPAANHATQDGEVRFYDARKQAAEFISLYHSIVLTAEQQEIKRQALSPVSAPCCENYSIASCCCPCNLAKSVWGLSHFLIATRGYDVEKVREDVERWIQFTNQDGYSGVACFKRRCERPFADDGCGGMDERRVL